MNDPELEMSFEDRLRHEAEKAKAEGREDVQIPPIPWRSAMVMADALSSYFADSSPKRCVVCDSARETHLDHSIDKLDDTAMRISMLMVDIEQLFLEKFKREIPTDAEVRGERVRTEALNRRVSHKSRIPISDALRKAMAGKEAR
jgi:hypothetical protein